MKSSIIFFTKAVETITAENTKLLINTLKERIKPDGIDLDKLYKDYFVTIYPEKRSKLIRYSYFKFFF